MSLSRSLVLALLSSAAWMPGVDAAGLPDCDVPADFDKVRVLSRATRACDKEPACLARMDAQWKTVLAAPSAGVRVHRNYINTWRAITPAEIEAAYKTRLEAHPGDPAALVLYGLTLGLDRATEQIELYEKALAADAGYGWAHWHLANIFTGRHAPDRKDLARAKTHIAAWLQACPADDGGIEMVNEVEDREFAREQIERVRTAVEARDGIWAAERYVALWPAEFKAFPNSAHETLRARVRRDVQRIEAMKLEDAPAYWSALESGYELLGDTKALEAAQDGRARRLPCDSEAVSTARSRWSKVHPSPSEAAAKKRHALERYRFGEGLTARCPDATLAWSLRLYDAAAASASLPTKDAARTVDGLLAAYARAEAAGSASAPPYDRIADLYVERRFRLERVPGLLERARSNAQWAEIPKGTPEKERVRRDGPRRAAEWRWAFLEARTQNERGQKAALDASFAALKSQMDAEPDENRRKSMRTQYLLLRGEAAEREKRWADAFAYYRSDPALKASAERAWTHLGGKSETLKLLGAASAEAAEKSDWKVSQRAFPAGALERLGGGEWTSKALDGRRTLVNFWATWCGPCKKELPELQKLYDKVKDRTDLAVVTLNVDDNPGLVDPFMRENKYTFPVVLAAEMWDKLDVEHAIPTNWIVDAKGTVRLEGLGFDPDEAARWVDDMMARLEPPKPSDSTATASTDAR